MRPARIALKSKRFASLHLGFAGLQHPRNRVGRVRASHRSGAGCGSHWPLCNGVAVPLAPQIETIIEFTHRLMSAFSIALIAILIIWGFRVYAKGHPIRKSLVACGLLIVAEALAGAGLVLFDLVADNVSLQRAVRCRCT